jgi:hypothetical protein
VSQSGADGSNTVPRNSWARYDRKSIPWLARIPVVAGLLSLLLGCLGGTWAYASRASSRLMGTPVITVNPMPSVDQGATLITSQTFGTSWCLSLLPSIATFGLAFWWCNCLEDLYRARQPWVGLSRPGPSRLSLTLDYQNCWFPLTKSIYSRHWTIAIISCFSLIYLGLPVAIANYYYFERLPTQRTPLLRPRWHAWTYQFRDDITISEMKKVLNLSLDVLTNAKALSPWMSYREALLGFHRDTRFVRGSNHYRPFDSTGYWEFSTRMIRGQLDCASLDHRIQRGNSSNFITISLPEGLTLSNGDRTLSIDPCVRKEKPDRLLRDDEIPTYPAICGTWNWIELIEGDLDRPFYRWILAATHEASDPITDSAYQLSSSESDFSSALICEPQIFKGEGIVQLCSKDEGKDIRHAVVSNYTPLQEELLQPDLADEFSSMLNETVPLVDPATNGLSMARVQGAPSFQGDFLAWTVFQRAITRGEVLNVHIFPFYASTIFATEFAAAIDQLNFMNTPHSEDVRVVPLLWVSQLQLWTPAVAYCFGAVFCLASAMVCFGLGLSFRKNYLFPVIPESIVGTWSLLHKSTLIDTFKSIERPERMSLNKFYKEVERLDLKPVIGHPRGGDPCMELRVDVASELDTSAPEQPRAYQGLDSSQTTAYHDSSDSDSDSDASQRSFNGTRESTHLLSHWENAEDTGVS